MELMDNIMIDMLLPLGMYAWGPKQTEFPVSIFLYNFINDFYCGLVLIRCQVMIWNIAYQDCSGYRRQIVAELF